MKKTLWLLGGVMLSIALSSCSEESNFPEQSGSKEGQIMLSLSANADFINKTKAVVESSYENVDNYTVLIYDKDGNEKVNCKGAELPTKMPLTLPIGGYTVKAYYGVEHAASRDEFYVLGITEGTIKAEQRENVQVVCEPTCGRIAVNFDSEMATYFSDYNVKFGGTEALGTKTIDWSKTDTEPWYVKLKENGEKISFTITTTTKDDYINGDNKEQVTTKTGTFTLSRNKAYKMKIVPNYTPTTSGTVDIEITIDESTNDKEVDIEVPVDWV